MTEGAAGEAETVDMSTERLEAFSDGVLAVIITITAFELKVPSSASLAALRHELPLILVYLLSFANIGIYWNNHHHLLRLTPRISPAVMWSNLFLLFWLSLIPWLTAWAGAQYRHPVPAACYGLVAMLAAVAYWILVRSIIGANEGSHVASAISRDRKGLASIGLYAVGVGLSPLSPYLAYALYVTVALMWFVPDRRLVR
jgi:uncharacterized membrane protein